MLAVLMKAFGWSNDVTQSSHNAMRDVSKVEQNSVYFPFFDAFCAFKSSNYT